MSAQAPSRVMTAEQRRRRSERRQLGTGLLFVSPWLIGLVAFQIYPFFSSLYYSFRSTTMLNSGHYVGLENYRTLIHDPLFWKSLKNTMIYVVAFMVLGTTFSLGMALLLNRRMRGMTVYRAIFYIPTVVPLVASSLVFVWILHPRYGIVNFTLQRLGLPRPGWFSDPRWAMPGLILFALWGVGNAVIIYLAGLQDIPFELHEAAMLDGASAWRRTLTITLPLLTPVILYNVIIGLIAGFQYFVPPYVITQGGPADSTLTYSLYLYRNAFQFFKMGYASAMAWLLFMAIITVTLILMKTSSRWVYYHGR